MGRSSFLGDRARTVVADHKVLRIRGSAFSSHLRRTPLLRRFVKRDPALLPLLCALGKCVSKPANIGGVSGHRFWNGFGTGNAPSRGLHEHATLGSLKRTFSVPLLELWKS